MPGFSPFELLCYTRSLTLLLYGHDHLGYWCLLAQLDIALEHALMTNRHTYGILWQLCLSFRGYDIGFSGCFEVYISWCVHLTSIWNLHSLGQYQLHPIMSILQGCVVLQCLHRSMTLTMITMHVSSTSTQSDVAGSRSRRLNDCGKWIDITDSGPKSVRKSDRQRNKDPLSRAILAWASITGINQIWLDMMNCIFENALNCCQGQHVRRL